MSPTNRKKIILDCPKYKLTRYGNPAITGAIQESIIKKKFWIQGQYDQEVEQLIQQQISEFMGQVDIYSSESLFVDVPTIEIRKYDNSETEMYFHGWLIHNPDYSPIQFLYKEGVMKYIVRKGYVTSQDYYPYLRQCPRIQIVIPD